MGSQVVEYEDVIRDLERRRSDINAEFDAAINAMKKIAALQSGSSHRVSPSLPFSPEMRTRPYQGLSMADAAIAHLRSVGHPVKNPELARAVEHGGFAHKSKNFPNTLNSILWRRSRTVGDIKKATKIGWFLPGMQQ